MELIPPGLNDAPLQHVLASWVACWLSVCGMGIIVRPRIFPQACFDCCQSIWCEPKIFTKTATELSAASVQTKSNRGMMKGKEGSKV